MTADESVRYRLQRKLEELVGPEEAAELMASTPPFPWTDLATKRDLDVLARELRGEIGELRGEIGELRGEIGTVRGEIGTVRGEIGTVRGEIGTVRGEMGSQTRTIIVANFVTVLTAVGLVLAAMHFAP